MFTIDDGCFHGGAFFESIGDRFDDLTRRYAIINADVLDAWFPPAPGVLTALTEHLDWLARTSPPTTAAGLRATIANVRGIPEATILASGGSSALMFLALREWLTPHSRVLLLDPCYGEYAHIFERVIGCHVDRFPLHRSEGWMPDLDELRRRLARGYDLFVLVNPNNPTGQLVPRRAIERLIADVPASTRVWVDEAYLDFVDGAETMEGVAASSRNVFVCKSLSKAYALSGMRAAYLCGPTNEIGRLRPLVPPWSVSLPAQIAAVKALEDLEYYRERYRQTNALRADLKATLWRAHGIAEVSGNANFLLCHLQDGAPTVHTILERCRRLGVFIRDVSSMGRALGSRVFRVAVKNQGDNARIVDTIAAALVQTLDHRLASEPRSRIFVA
jgi:histidinol-phosphate/aromatic aminotransferase/cobyric acid decarboxylase-like protein